MIVFCYSNFGVVFFFYSNWIDTLRFLFVHISFVVRTIRYFLEVKIFSVTLDIISQDPSQEEFSKMDAFVVAVGTDEDIVYSKSTAVQVTTQK